MNQVPIPTKQEMFDRAVRGLRSQGWTRSVDADGLCVYHQKSSDGPTQRCAWGHVDPVGTAGAKGCISDLRRLKVGLAAHLPDELFEFASWLQIAHDTPISSLEEEFRRFGRNHGLTWPEGS